MKGRGRQYGCAWEPIKGTGWDEPTEHRCIETKCEGVRPCLECCIVCDCTCPRDEDEDEDDG